MQQRNVLKQKISNAGLNDLITEGMRTERDEEKTVKDGKAKGKMEGKLWRR